MRIAANYRRPQKLTVEQVGEIKFRIDQGEDSRTLAHAYQVGISTINQIKLGKT